MEAVARSKRLLRPRSPKDIEYGMPYVEEGTVFDKETPVSARLMSRFAKAPSLMHTKPIRYLPSSLLERVGKSLNVPLRYENVGPKPIERIQNVKTLIIGGGDSSIVYYLANRDDKTLLISDSIRPFFENPEFFLDPHDDDLTSLKKAIKDIKHLPSRFIGKFDEGIVLEGENAFYIVSPQNIFIGTGGRYVSPIFRNNDLPGVISKSLYLHSQLYKKDEIHYFIGSTDDILRSALIHKGGSIVFYKRGTDLFSSFFREKAEERGVELIAIDTLYVKGRGRVEEIVYDGNSVHTDLLVFGIIKQPRLEVTSNLGCKNKILPSGLIVPDLCPEGIRPSGGAVGISDPHNSMRDALNETMDLQYERQITEKVLVSPYITDNGGFACECEDVPFKEVLDLLSRGYKNTEEVKRLAGLGTGTCQGRNCVYQIASHLRDPAMITFRSPIFPVRGL